MCTDKNASKEKEPLQADSRKKSDENEGKGKAGEEDWYYDYSDEPHVTRRKQILAKYPQIKELYGYDPNTKYIVTVVVAIQIALAYYMRFVNGWIFFACAYVIGGTLNHMLMFAMHECVHNLVFKHMYHNRLFSLFANLPVVIPSAITFKRYHMDHHKYQGEESVDVVIPTNWEARFFQGRFMKLLFVILQVFPYALRPLFINRKQWSSWEYVNAASCFAFDAVIAYFWGPWSLLYLFASSVLGCSLHPMAAHFIAEHYIFVPGNETYSYYGPLNIFGFNIGYHNEHHDFPNIPGSRLPEVQKIAPEFYNDLPQHDSYCMVLYNFIMDPNITLYSRIKRQRLSRDEKVEIQKR